LIYGAVARAARIHRATARLDFTWPALHEAKLPGQFDCSGNETDVHVAHC
jgi:hypothetical protein